MRKNKLHLYYAFDKETGFYSEYQAENKKEVKRNILNRGLEVKNWEIERLY